LLFIVFSSPVHSFTAPQILTTSPNNAASIASTSTSSSALYGKRKNLKKKIKKIIGGRTEEEGGGGEAAVLSPDIDALSNFLVDGTYSGKKRNIIKKQLKKIVSLQEKEEKAETTTKSKSSSSLETETGSTNAPVVDGTLSEKIEKMVSLGNMVSLVEAETETTKASSSSSSSPPKQKIVPVVVSNNSSSKSVNDDDSSRRRRNTSNSSRMVKQFSTNEKEAKKLSKKYAQIDDVGEKAFQILLDLGMIGN